MISNKFMLLNVKSINVVWKYFLQAFLLSYFIFFPAPLLQEQDLLMTSTPSLWSGQTRTSSESSISPENPFFIPLVLCPRPFHLQQFPFRMYCNGELQYTIDPGTSFYDFGGFAAAGSDNPWVGRGKMAPFDQKVGNIV